MNYPLNEVSAQDVQTVGELIVAARDGFKGGLEGTKPNSNSLKTYSYSSAAKAASKLIAVFPILISRTVSAGTAQMISKYIEQKGCILLQLALQQANISNAANGIEYLRNFHQNLNIGGGSMDYLTKTLDTWIDSLRTDDSAAQADHDRLHGASEGVSLSQTMAAEMKNINENFDDSWIYESDKDLTINSIQMRELMEIFREAESIQVYDTQLNPICLNDYIVEDYGNEDYHVSIKSIGLNEKVIRTRSAEERNAIEDARKDIKFTQSQEDREREERERTNKSLSIARATLPRMQDQDIKKMNGAVPSLLVVRFYNDSNASVVTEFIIGVKSKVLGVNSDEILRRIANDNKDGKKFVNLMRTITGELKVSDFLFGLSRINDDLKSTRKKGAQGEVWRLLQNRSMAAKEQVKHGRINDYSAITTVVISQEDCDALYREENIDITNPSIADHFMSSYNLLAFIIVDDALESVKILFDDDDKYFDEISYMMLERETQDGTYKKLINLIASSR